MKLLVVLLLLLSGAAALPSRAEAAETKSVWFFRCSYNGQPEYRSQAFTVTSEGMHAPADEVLAGWKAVLRSKGLLRYDSDAYCAVAYAGDLPQVQSLLYRRPDLRYETVDWMPDFGVPYQLPREVYYYCSESQEGLQRRFVTDLFKAPLPEDLSLYLRTTYRKHESWLREQGLRPYSTNAGCTALSPEPYQAYARYLDAVSVVTDPDRPFHLTRSSWPGVDPVAAPNLIDDLAARAKYAKMSIAPPAKTAKAAPPPPPKPKAGGPPLKVPALTIKEDTSAKDAAKAREEAMQRSAKAESEQKAKIAALKAKSDAEFKTKMDAFWAERRRQGNSQ